MDETAVPPDHFQALGLSKDATLAQIKTAWRKGALQHHPDKATDKSAAADAFHRVQQAYETLTDPDKRKRYEDQVKNYHTKRDLFERKATFPRASGYGGTSSATHSRGNSGEANRPSPHYSPRQAYPSTFADHVYEERRPRQPMYEDEPAFSRYDYHVPREEPMRASSRKFDGYTATKRTPPKPMSRPEEPPRAASRQAKPAATTKPKERVDAKKQQDRAVKRERERKQRAPTPLSSESETDGSFNNRRMPPRTQEPSRRRAASRDSEPDSRDERSHKMADQMNFHRDYVLRSTRDISPDGRSDVRQYRSEAFAGYNSPSTAREAEPHGRRSSARPGLVRRESSKAKENPPPTSRPRASSVADKKPPSSMRSTDPPGLFHSASTPSSGANLASMVGGGSRRDRERERERERDRNRSSNSSDDEELPPPKPTMRRAETAPMRGGRQESISARRASDVRMPPIKTSAKTAHHDQRDVDSGYSTSNSPSESPMNEYNDYPGTAPKTQTYSYGKKSVGPDAPRPSTSDRYPSHNQERTPRSAASERFPGPAPSFDEPDFRSTRHATVPLPTEVRSPRARDSPSPHSRPQSSKHRADYPAPPPSRSASFNPGRDSVERESSQPSRRPSVSRSGSSKSKPSFARSSTTPLSLNTKSARDGLLFGEQATASPTDYHNSSGPDSGRERSGTSRRPSEDLRPSSGSARPSSGRSSRPPPDEKTRSAKKYMDRMTEERAPPRSPRARAYA